MRVGRDSARLSRAQQALAHKRLRHGAWARDPDYGRAVRRLIDGKVIPFTEGLDQHKLERMLAPRGMRLKIGKRGFEIARVWRGPSKRARKPQGELVWTKMAPKWSKAEEEAEINRLGDPDRRRSRKTRTRS
jgi:hypothetical protein